MLYFPEVHKKFFPAMMMGLFPEVLDMSFPEIHFRFVFFSKNVID